MKRRKTLLLLIISGSVVLLNLYFAWTSHVLSNYPAAQRLIYGFAKLQMKTIGLAPYFASLSNNFCLNPINAASCFPDFGPNWQIVLSTRFFIDTEAIALVFIIFAANLLLFVDRGKIISVIRALQVTPLSVIPLGIEIYIFDRIEFSTEASVIQAKNGIFSSFSFTNEELLLACLSMVIITTAFEIASRRKSLRNSLPS